MSCQQLTRKNWQRVIVGAIHSLPPGLRRYLGYQRISDREFLVKLPIKARETKLTEHPEAINMEVIFWDKLRYHYLWMDKEEADLQREYARLHGEASQIPDRDRWQEDIDLLDEPLITIRCIETGSDEWLKCYLAQQTKQSFREFIQDAITSELSICCDAILTQ